jgi:hypothetical protein
MYIPSKKALFGMRFSAHVTASFISVMDWKYQHFKANLSRWRQGQASKVGDEASTETFLLAKTAFMQWCIFCNMDKSFDWYRTSVTQFILFKYNFITSV